VRTLFIAHGTDQTSEGRALQLLRHWLSSAQRAQFVKKGYFELAGGDTGKHYRIHVGAISNVCEIDHKGRPVIGLCFRTVGELPIGDVMLAQKIALESCESYALSVARKFEPNASMLRRRSFLGLTDSAVRRHRPPQAWIL
jgi:hypothetical protein